MFFNLLRFEVKDRLWRPSSFAYFFTYFMLAFLLGIAFAGAFKGASVSFGFSNKLALNSPVVLAMLTSYLGYLGLLVTAPIFGQSINKDFENKFSQILFATPLKKRTYFFVRYFGSFIVTLLILSSIGVGVFVSTLMPFIDRSLVADQHLRYYVAPYLTNVIPNTLIFGAVFLAVISIFKKMAPVYVASIAVFTGWMISQTLTRDLDNKRLAALIEPFGLEGASQVTRYWSITEQSTNTIPMTGVLLLNRMLWGSIGAAFLIFAYRKFNPFKLPAEKKQSPEISGQVVSVSRFSEIKLPMQTVSTGSPKVFGGLALSEFKQAFSNIYFLMILLCGVIYVFAISGEANKFYGTEALPVTYMMLDFIGGTFGLFVVIITAYYAGELVWKDRDQHFAELIDSKPISNAYLYLSKLLSLFCVQIFLMLIVLVCSVIVQIAHGYFNFEWLVYLKHLVVYGLPSRLLLCVFALFIQTLARNKYVGHAILVLYFVLLLWVPSLGLDHMLYLVGKLPHALYSDMNGFGTSWYPFAVLSCYWGFFYLGLATLSVLFWPRGQRHSLKESVVEAKRRAGRASKFLLILSTTGFLVIGLFIFYNTNILNVYQTKAGKERRQVEYEKTYKTTFENKPRPTLVKVKLAAEIYPETQSLKMHGHLDYINKSGVEISKTMLVYNDATDFKITSLNWSRTVKVSSEPKIRGVMLLEFSPPLKLNEAFSMDYQDEIVPHGFSNDEFSKTIVQNGTFFNNSDINLFMGYQPNAEMADDKSRRKYGLAERPRVPDLHDPAGLRRNGLSGEADWIDYDATVSTSPDQIAVSPGYLEKEWNENGRRYFHYKMDAPILDFYSFLSARYEVVRDEWKGVKIEVYHHPGHNTDIPRMIKSIKAGLDYYGKNFSPFQYRQFRILEFPRYATFAQSFPNTIPFSEAIGFIAKIDDQDPESIDLPFYVTSHELAHQWWGHQVVGADVQGSSMLVESLAQYSALMVQEKEYGPKQMKKFLKYELDKYLFGRSQEKKKELPIELTEGQAYIHYQKGSLVFYALKDYLGEGVVNGVLRQFIKDYAFQSNYPTAPILVERFKKVAPPNLQYLIHDLFETVTLYDNQTKLVTVKPVKSKFLVTLISQNKKVQADELGKEVEVPMKDFIDVGLYDAKGELFYLEKHVFQSGENKIEIMVDRLPAKAGVDPINKLIDRVPEDNVQKVSK
jgi:ABC-2 type transport system permease protein